MSSVQLDSRLMYTSAYSAFAGRNVSGRSLFLSILGFGFLPYAAAKSRLQRLLMVSEIGYVYIMSSTSKRKSPYLLDGHPYKSLRDVHECRMLTRPGLLIPEESR